MFLIRLSKLKLLLISTSSDSNLHSKYLDSFSIKWPTIKYKAQPEKIVPAKDARISRGKSLRIKENK